VLGYLAKEKKGTLACLAASFLYTVRNNQFHAVKGAHNLMDQTILMTAYMLLDPIVEALLSIASQEIREIQEANSP